MEGIVLKSMQKKRYFSPVLKTLLVTSFADLCSRGGSRQRKETARTQTKSFPARKNDEMKVYVRNNRFMHMYIGFIVNSVVKHSLNRSTN